MSLVTFAVALVLAAEPLSSSTLTAVPPWGRSDGPWKVAAAPATAPALDGPAATIEAVPLPEPAPTDSASEPAVAVVSEPLPSAPAATPEAIAGRPADELERRGAAAPAATLEAGMGDRAAAGPSPISGTQPSTTADVRLEAHLAVRIDNGQVASAMGQIASSALQPGGAVSQAVGALGEALTRATSPGGVPSRSAGSPQAQPAEAAAVVASPAVETARTAAQAYGSVLELPVVSEAADASGRTIRLVRDTSGALIQVVLDRGRLVGVALVVPAPARAEAAPAAPSSPAVVPVPIAPAADPVPVPTGATP